MTISVLESFSELGILVIGVSMFVKSLAQLRPIMFMSVQVKGKQITVHHSYLPLEVIQEC